MTALAVLWIGARRFLCLTCDGYLQTCRRERMLPHFPKDVDEHRRLGHDVQETPA